MSYHNGSATIVLGSQSGIVDEFELTCCQDKAIERKPVQSPKRRKLDEVSATIRRARFYLNALECIKSNYATPLGTVESLTDAVEEGVLDAITDVIVKF